MKGPSPLQGTAGLLLAGGRSLRFGAEKAVALFRGRALMDSMAERFDGCMPLAVSARANSAAARLAMARDWGVLHDDPAHPVGPLAGVCVGLAWASAVGAEFLAMAPCDSPLLPNDIFEQLHSVLGDAPAVRAVTRHGEHPLCAVWRVSLLAPLASALDGGSHPAVRDFLNGQGAALFHFECAERFANCNTPEDLRAMESIECNH